MQRFFEDSHFRILSILREERFTAFSIDIFKSESVRPQGKPRAEHFQFISHEDGNNKGGTLRQPSAACTVDLQSTHGNPGALLSELLQPSPLWRATGLPLPGLEMPGLLCRGLTGVQPSSSKGRMGCLPCHRPPQGMELAAPVLLGNDSHGSELDRPSFSGEQIHFLCQSPDWF